MGRPRDEIESLRAALLDGQALTAVDQPDLLEALKSDEALRREMLDDVEIHALLRARGWISADSDAFLREFAAQLVVERDADAFVASVGRQVRDTAKSSNHTTMSRRFLWPALASVASLATAAGWLMWRQQPDDPTYAGICCSDVLKLAKAYRARTLSDEKRGQIRSHLVQCSSCRKRYQEPG